jgi:hypothetical protein
LGDGILSIIQNGYRACKKYIAINFDYYLKTIQYEGLRNDIKNEILDLRAKNTKSTGLKKSNSLQSPFAP